MSRILVCQHVAFEILGTLNPLLRRHGVRIKYVNFGAIPRRVRTSTATRAWWSWAGR